MYREINRKRILLENRKPYCRELTDQMSRMETLDFIMSMMKVTGESLEKERMEEILEGVFFPEVRLGLYVRIQNWQNVLAEMRSMREMETSLSSAVTGKLFRILTGKQDSLRGEDSIGAFGFRAVPAKEVGERLEILMNWITRDGEMYETVNPLETEDLLENPSNFVLRAAYLHEHFLEIWPYEEANTEMALVLMYYYLLGKGYPVFSLSCSAEEYRTAAEEYLRGGGIGSFSSLVARSLFNRMELLMQMTAAE